jgi:hypothetical protein
MTSFIPVALFPALLCRADEIARLDRFVTRS